MKSKNRMLLIGIGLLVLCAFVGTVSATTWYVDDDGGADFTHIQDAIDNASAGDTIFVYNGTYYENITLKDGVRVQGEGADITTINGKGAGSVVTAVNVGSGTLLSGFTITNGTATYGGGIYIKSSSVVIENNTIIANMASAMGAGIGMYQNSLPTITGNIITQNGGQLILLFGEWVLGPVNGGGIEVHGSSPTITNNIISENSARYGGGINFMAHSGGQAINNVLMDNTATQLGGGIDIYLYSSPDITNNIIVDNSGTGIHVRFESTPLIDFNDIWNNTGGKYGGDASAGVNDISADPLFVNPAIGDYHLKSTQGSYHGGAWTPDANISPCIDAGDPTSPYDNEPEPNGNRINMGAYGNTNQASKSPIATPYVVSCDDSGTEQNTFDLSEDVYCRGENLAASTSVDIYVVNNKDDWEEGDELTDVSGRYETETTGDDGSISTTLIWGSPLTLGSYDIVVDKNQNGEWNKGDPIDDKVNVGFEAVPEFTTIAIPVAAILGLVFLFSRKRKREE